MPKAVRLPNCYIVLTELDDNGSRVVGVIPCNSDSLERRTNQVRNVIRHVNIANPDSKWDTEKILAGMTAAGIPCCKNVTEVQLS